MSQQTHVLYVLGTGDLVGGAQFSALLLLSNLDRQKHRVTVLAPESGSLTDRIMALGLDVRFEPLLLQRAIRGHLPEFLRSGFRLASWMRRESVDLLHNDNWSPGARVLGMLAARVFSRRPYVHHERDVWIPSARVDRLTGRLATRIVVISNTVARKFDGIASSKKLRVIYNGVDLNRFQRTPCDVVRESLGVAPGTPLIGIFSRISREKGHHLILGALAHLRSRLHGVRLLVVGRPFRDGNEYDLLLRRESERLGISDLVIRTGFRDDVPDLMSACDLTVCPSAEEPFGRVVVESMACSRPVVAMARGGPVEIIDSGRTGVLVDSEDPAVWADALEQLLKNPESMIRMGQRARVVVEERFGVERYVEEIVSVWAELSG